LLLAEAPSLADPEPSSDFPSSPLHSPPFGGGGGGAGGAGPALSFAGLRPSRPPTFSVSRTGGGGAVVHAGVPFGSMPKAQAQGRKRSAEAAFGRTNEYGGESSGPSSSQAGSGPRTKVTPKRGTIRKLKPAAANVEMSRTSADPAVPKRRFKQTTLSPSLQPTQPFDEADEPEGRFSDEDRGRDGREPHALSERKDPSLRSVPMTDGDLELELAEAEADEEGLRQTRIKLPKRKVPHMRPALRMLPATTELTAAVLCVAGPVCCAQASAATPDSFRSVSEFEQFLLRTIEDRFVPLNSADGPFRAIAASPVEVALTRSAVCAAAVVGVRRFIAAVTRVTAPVAFPASAAAAGGVEATEAAHCVRIAVLYADASSSYRETTYGALSPVLGM
jgi:hypothetical protein